MTPKFEKTPEQQASMLNFWRQQIFSKPKEVRGSERLLGKTAIVTGSNTGVGFQTARQLLDLGLTKLILAVRNEEKGNAAAAKLSHLGLADGANIEVWLLDQSSYISITSFVERARGLERLDLVNLNVGLVFEDRVFNASTGHDETIQVNYLSTALLALTLLPILDEKRDDNQPGRITFTSSEASAWTKFDERGTDGPLFAAFDQADAKVDPMDRQWLSKLLGQFFIARLAAEIPPSVALINCASPGIVYDSEFMRGMQENSPVVFSIAMFVLKYFVNSSAVGARMITDAMVNHGEETHGQFLSFQKLVPMSPIIYTEEGQAISDKLWRETMTELSFAKVEEILRALKQ